MGLSFCCVLITLFILITSQVYDPCGYVGSSNDPKMTSVCLQTSTDCCYMQWAYSNYVYYSCISKSKLVENGESKNLTFGFRINTYDDNSTFGFIDTNLSRIMYSVCNDSSDVIVSKPNSVPSNPYIRSLQMNVEDEEVSYFDKVKYDITSNIEYAITLSSKLIKYIFKI